MKRKFDIKFRPQIESGEYKLETELGNQASIMDWEWNHNGEKRLAVKVPGHGKDNAFIYDYEGKRVCIFPPEEGSDLFIVTPEPELTEFEATLLSYLSNDTSGELDKETVHKCVKARAKELLELAKKELDSEEGKVLLHVNEKAYKIGFRDGKAEGYEKAMKEFKELPALTWLPKSIPTHILSCPYSTSGCTNLMRDCINCPSFPTAGISSTTGTSTSKVEGKE